MVIYELVKTDKDGKVLFKDFHNDKSALLFLMGLDNESDRAHGIKTEIIEHGEPDNEEPIENK